MLRVLTARPKAGSQGYQTILRETGAVPERSAMTGDHLDEDVLRAQQNGMKGLWATWYVKTGSGAQAVPDLVLNSPAELTHLVLAAR